MGLFGKDSNRDPKEQVREWSRKLRQEMRLLDRQINGIQREEQKVTKQIKDAAKKSDRDVCKILAKEVVRSRKAVGKIYTTKAQINSVIMDMNNQLSVLRMSGCMQRSAEVMKSMQSLLRVSDVAATMRELSREMTKAGVIDEMLEETLESSLDSEGLEEESEQEVERVLSEIISDEFKRAPRIQEGEPRQPEAEPAAAAANDEPEQSMDEMRARLEALRS